MTPRPTPFVAQATIDSPLGPLLLAATHRGLAGAWFDGQAHHPGPLSAPVRPDHPWLVEAALAFAQYWQDASDRAPNVALDPQGTPFQRAVWQALRAIPCGRCTTYGALAAEIGRPRAVRAVGAAVGRNPLAVLVPCHRVLGRDGSLTGYAGGLARKMDLLAREGVHRASRGLAGDCATPTAGTRLAVAEPAWLA